MRNNQLGSKTHFTSSIEQHSSAAFLRSLKYQSNHNNLLCMANSTATADAYSASFQSPYQHKTSNFFSSPLAVNYSSNGRNETQQTLLSFQRSSDAAETNFQTTSSSNLLSGSNFNKTLEHKTTCFTHTFINEFFCVTCKREICSHCVFMTPGSHKGHETLTLRNYLIHLQQKSRKLQQI